MIRKSQERLCCMCMALRIPPGQLKNMVQTSCECAPVAPQTSPHIQKMHREQKQMQHAPPELASAGGALEFPSWTGTMAFKPKLMVWSIATSKNCCHTTSDCNSTYFATGPGKVCKDQCEKRNYCIKFAINHQKNCCQKHCSN